MESCTTPDDRVPEHDRAPEHDTAPEDVTSARRVRVVLAGERQGRPDPARPDPARPDPARQEIEEQTRIGEVLVQGLIRAQLALAVRLSLVIAGAFGVLPLLFALAPGVAEGTLFGLRLPWLLLGVLTYPVLIGVAWVYVRLADRNEQDFVDLVDRS